MNYTSGVLQFNLLQNNGIFEILAIIIREYLSIVPVFYRLYVFFHKYWKVLAVCVYLLPFGSSSNTA